MSRSHILIDQIEQSIIHDISSGKLMIGEKIPNEFELAEQYDVSRGTIREVIKMLTSKNILEIRRGKGTFVCQEPGLQDDPMGLAFCTDKYKTAYDLLQMRCVIEPEIAAMAAQEATAEQIRTLYQLSDTIDSLYAKRTLTFVEQDKLFHTEIAKCTNNSVMPRLIPIITSGIDCYNEAPELRNSPVIPDSIRHHRIIVHAIEQHDPQLARNLMREHLNINLENLRLTREQVKKHG